MLPQSPKVGVEANGNAATRWRRRTFVSVVAVMLSLAGWAFLIEPGWLGTERHTLVVPHWPAELDGFRVVVITDLHVGAPHVGLAQLDEVVERSNAEQADLIVLLGDFVIQGVLGGDFVEPEVTALALGRLRARHGVIAVLGNHDWWLDGERVAAALRGVGISVLENDAMQLEHEGRPLWVAGLADLITRDPDIAKSLAAVGPDQPVLLLTHSPDVFPEVPSRVSLTLAGHTHGGQVSVPLYGPPIVPSRFGRRYAQGHVVEEQRHLFVGVGVGTSMLPVRFLVRPRIDVLTLKGPHRR